MALSIVTISPSLCSARPWIVVFWCGVGWSGTVCRYTTVISPFS